MISSYLITDNAEYIYFNNIFNWKYCCFRNLKENLMYKILSLIYPCISIEISAYTIFCYVIILLIVLSS